MNFAKQWPFLLFTFVAQSLRQFYRKMSKGHRTHSSILWTAYRKRNLILFLAYYAHGRREWNVLYWWFSQRERPEHLFGCEDNNKGAKIQLTWIIVVVITDFTPCDSNNLWWQIWGLLLVIYGLCVFFQMALLLFVSHKYIFIPDLS